MTTFEHVKELLSRMTLPEINTLKKFLEGFEEVRPGECLKMRMLLELLLDKVNPARMQDLPALIYKKESKKNFSKLLQRLKEKIHESFILGVNLSRPEAYSQQFKIKYEIRKLSITASIIRGRGSIKVSRELNSRIIERCIEYEIYDELIEALYIEKFTSGLLDGEKDLGNYTLKIEFYEKCRSTLNKARDYYNRSSVISEYRSNPQTDLLELRGFIIEIQDAYFATSSANVGYYLLYLKITYYLNLKQYNKAAELCLEQVELVKTNKAIYMKRRIGIIHLELSNIQLLSYSFEDSIINTLKGLKNIPKKSYNYGTGLETIFYAHFYLRNFETALKVINKLLLTKSLSHGSFVHKKWTYFKSCCLFMNGRFHEAFQLLQTCQEIEADKNGWNIGIRLLTIMTEIELELFDHASRRMNNFRRFIERNNKIEIDPRYTHISNILMKLLARSFNFNKALINNEKLINELGSSSGDHFWKIKSGEMVIFDVWFMSKVNKIPFRNTLPVLEAMELKKEYLIGQS